MRFLKHNLGEGGSVEPSLVHVVLDKSLFEEVVSGLDPLSAEALGALFVVGHLSSETSHCLGGYLFSKAASNDFNMWVFGHYSDNELLQRSDPANSGIVDGSPTSWEDEAFDCLELFI